jgi:membrane protein DedA with SNARE-associated domain
MMVPENWYSARGVVGPWAQFAALFLSTFASEDLTCVTAGLLVRDGRLNVFVALLGCFVGILVGDVGLWLLGRWVGAGLLHRCRLVPVGQVEQLGRWFEQRGWAAVLAARFLPGLRLPLYLAAGVLGRKTGTFLLWVTVGGLIWTPLLVASAALLGPVLVGPLTSLLGRTWLVLPVGVVALFGVVRAAILLCTPAGRGTLVATVSRLWRWEFWPSWLFYLPVLPWLAYLSVRYRGILTWTAANPGIPQGGVVGESKYAILEQLSPEWVVPSVLVPPGEIGERLSRLRVWMTEGRQFPLIFKPDASQRGAGVRKVTDPVEAEKYLLHHPAAVLVQTYHPGPYEAGIFYYRLPGEEAGHIFSITDKVFPVLAGTGKATVEELIRRHPRYRMQAQTFLLRHRGQRDRLLGEGELLPLALAGNHCQGTLFRDGAHLLTPELERAVDAVARHFPGFFVGRFDVRYADPEAFRAGLDLAIVELNGATAESTNIYDPSWSILTAYRTLFRQWWLLYRIGAANRRRGHAPAELGELLRVIVDYYRRRQVDLLSD